MEKEIQVKLWVTIDTKAWSDDMNVEEKEIPVDVSEYIAGLVEGSYAGTNNLIIKVATSK